MVREVLSVHQTVSHCYLGCLVLYFICCDKWDGKCFVVDALRVIQNFTLLLF